MGKEEEEMRNENWERFTRKSGVTDTGAKEETNEKEEEEEEEEEENKMNSNWHFQKLVQQ